MTQRKHEVELELERTQRELREAREARLVAEASVADLCRVREHLTRQLGVLRAERDEARGRARAATQAIVEAIGSVGPESIEGAVVRIVATLATSRRHVQALIAARRPLARQRDEALESARCEASLRARWERRTDEARAELRALVAGLSLDDGPRAKAIQHARAVLEEWGMR